MRLFAQHKDDKKRIEAALEKALGGLPGGKKEAISPAQFTYPVFEAFYKQLVGRAEVKRVFDSLTNGSKHMNLGECSFLIYLNKLDLILIFL